MSVSSSQASLRALRQDLDLSANGSMRETSILNRDGQRSSGDVRLSDYKGSLTGGQLRIAGAGNATPNLRYNGYWGFYPANGGQPNISGNTIRTYSRMTGYGGEDASSEYRVSGYVNESATYRLTGEVTFTRSGNYRVQSWQVAVVGSASGYLSGIKRNELLLAGDNPGTHPINSIVSLTTSRPYITLVVYSITKDGGNFSEGSFTTTWKNLKLVKE
ncbi:MAG: hypothetical protein L7S57_04580 [Luminiphilus sp.]|nr:hypothetical protein [Luminiphilus sp.]